jgi:hypothetical protein
MREITPVIYCIDPRPFKPNSRRQFIDGRSQEEINCLSHHLDDCGGSEYMQLAVKFILRWNHSFSGQAEVNSNILILL